MIASFRNRESRNHQHRSFYKGITTTEERWVTPRGIKVSFSLIRLSAISSWLIYFGTMRVHNVLLLLSNAKSQIIHDGPIHGARETFHLVADVTLVLGRRG